ncbi:MAG: RNA 2',3'-cyclic phosphodiesterase [Deltaproteobacteria bacterium]|nr:RNA 2',3'-cyclic phosphodiesterase [Deltaproteobacteria bacterium]
MPAGTDERWRCFVAIDLEDPARAEVDAFLGGLRATISGVAWTRPGNLHLTLAFFGDVPASAIPELTPRLARALAGVERFTARVIGVGAFPSLARPQVLWVGVVAPPLPALADAVRRAGEAAGIARERRPFRPHVTLGRMRARIRGAAFDPALFARDGGRDFGAAPVARVILYQSELAPDGARHSPLAVFPLDRGDGFP